MDKIHRMPKKKPSQEAKSNQVSFRLEPEEMAAYEQYCKSERFPLTRGDLASRLFREFLVQGKFLKQNGEADSDE